jgi:DNA-binding PadR family transcriptional regulator
MGGEGRGLFGGRGSHEGRGRRGKRFAGEELRLMVLALLEDGPKHGYQLIRAFADRSAEAYSPSPGVLYPLLTLLADMDLIAEADGEGRSRSFALTDAGRAELAAGQATAKAAFARLAAMGEEEARVDPTPIRRAVMNLRTAAIQRMGAPDADRETAFAIADLIDEAARKIERL